ncbi:hypothetical protein, partial [Pseudoalteromonas phenolica]|uniref:hypothetical protein n=1 Tax=Pseudoalteromonas phenolica TaxID=161398 RepID=UPI00110AF177
MTIENRRTIASILSMFSAVVLGMLILALTSSTPISVALLLAFIFISMLLGSARLYLINVGISTALKLTFGMFLSGVFYTGILAAGIILVSDFSLFKIAIGLVLTSSVF